MSFDMNKLMQQAAEMQQQMEKMQKEAANEVAEASVGGGMVKVTANGAGEVMSIIDLAGRDRPERSRRSCRSRPRGQ